MLFTLKTNTKHKNINLVSFNAVVLCCFSRWHLLRTDTLRETTALRQAGSSKPHKDVSVSLTPQLRERTGC